MSSVVFSCRVVSVLRMAEAAHHKENQSQELQQLLILKPPVALPTIEAKLSKRFKILKAWESPLPIHTFLTTYAQSVKAMLCSAGTHITADLLRLLPSLQLIVTSSAGLNQIDLPECSRRRIAVANSGTVFSADVADLAVSLLMDVLRNISAADRYVRAGLWPIKGDYPLGSKIIIGKYRQAAGNDLIVVMSLVAGSDGDVGGKHCDTNLCGKRVGIVGLGNIGLEVAKRLEAFGCSISYNSRNKKPSVSYPYYSNVCELAASSDCLIICCALTDQTRHMINKEVLLALGKEGVIINIGRGAIIDEKEMVQCLVQGEIGGAGLDVFENEPEVPKELFALDNVVLSPHRAVFTPETFSDLCELIVGNLEAFFSNKPLLSPVMYE